MLYRVKELLIAAVCSLVAVVKKPTLFCSNIRMLCGKVERFQITANLLTLPCGATDSSFCFVSAGM